MRCKPVDLFIILVTTFLSAITSLTQLTNAIDSESYTSSVYLPSPIDCERKIDEGDSFNKVQGGIQLNPTQIDADNDDLRGAMDLIIYSSSIAR